MASYKSVGFLEDNKARKAVKAADDDEKTEATKEDLMSEEELENRNILESMPK